MSAYIFNKSLNLSDRILVVSKAIDDYKNDIPFTIDNKEIDLLVRVSYFLLKKNNVNLNTNMLSAIVLLAFGNYDSKTENELIAVFSESFYNIKDENEKKSIVNASNLILQILKIMCPYCISKSLNNSKNSTSETVEKSPSQAKKPTLN